MTMKRVATMALEGFIVVCMTFGGLILLGIFLSGACSTSHGGVAP